ncbi:MAG: leucine-rich repeat domain-containing protein, partial [Firmicutes bacterium]|nr:leucine-rich repeat domain-containing protein [Bacillota bacterium]
LLYVKIPDEVTSFGSYAFHGCRHLSEISFPASLLSIGDYAFYGCYCLSSSRIPDGVTTIGARVFYECATVPEFTVPSSTVSIGNYAFYGCRSVHDYYVYAAVPPTLGGTSVFSGIASDCVIHVPSESLSAYQSATRWSSLTAYIAGDL